MVRATSEKVGRGLCPNAHCGEPVMYRKSSGGMLTHKCEVCDSSGYAAPGGDAYAKRMATIKVKATPAADPPITRSPALDPEPEKVPEPPKKRVANSAFSLGDL